MIIAVGQLPFAAPGAAAEVPDDDIRIVGEEYCLLTFLNGKAYIIEQYSAVRFCCFQSFNF